MKRLALALLAVACVSCSEYRGGPEVRCCEHREVAPVVVVEDRPVYSYYGGWCGYWPWSSPYVGHVRYAPRPWGVAHRPGYGHRVRR